MHAETLSFLVIGAFLAAALYILSFHALLVGSKVLMALAAGKAGTLATGRGRLWILRALGMSLFVFAALFLYDGIRLPL
jgi:hypothetical protein